MTVNQDQLATGVEDVRTLLQADGGDIELVGVDEPTGRVDLRLILDTAECAECVLPRDMLERIGLDIIRKAAPDVATLHISDPREAG